MALKRKGFVLSCDTQGCDTEIDLETDDFEEAKDQAREERETGGWTTVQRGGSYADICPNH